MPSTGVLITLLLQYLLMFLIGVYLLIKYFILNNLLNGTQFKYVNNLQ